MIRVKNIGDMAFEATGPSGLPIVMDSSPKFGGQDKGPRPMEVLLMAAAGCTGMDVVSLMKKMRVEYSHFWIDVDADRASEHPKIYTRIDMVFNVVAKEEDRPKIEKAVRLSQERYCAASVHLKALAELSWRVVIHETLPEKERWQETSM